jgi:3-isopropylmalate dehydratase small subunit
MFSFLFSIPLLKHLTNTHQLAPNDCLTICKTAAEFGQHCLKHTHPGFRSRAAAGYNIVVAGQAFGCGSSREIAVSALLGCGIQAVIAKSFAFIYGRNAPNLGLLGIVIQEESFYEKARDGVEVEVDMEKSVVRVVGCDSEWPFEMSDMEKELIEIGGLTSAFRKFGKGLFDVLTMPKGKRAAGKVLGDEKGCGSVGDLQW